MIYHSYELPSAVTEEGLASMVRASVKDYLGGVADYVARASLSGWPELRRAHQQNDRAVNAYNAQAAEIAELKKLLQGKQ